MQTEKAAGELLELLLLCYLPLLLSCVSLPVSGNAWGSLQQEACCLSLPFLLIKWPWLLHRRWRAWRAGPGPLPASEWLSVSVPRAGREGKKRLMDWFCWCCLCVLDAGNGNGSLLQVFSPWSPDSLPPGRVCSVYQQCNDRVCTLWTPLSRYPLGWAAVVPKDCRCSLGAHDEWLGTVTLGIWGSREGVGRFRPWVTDSSVGSDVYWFGRAASCWRPLHGE